MNYEFERFRQKLVNMQLDATRRRVEAEWKEAFSKNPTPAGSTAPPKLTPYDIDFLKSCNIRWE